MVIRFLLEELGGVLKSLRSRPSQPGDVLNPVTAEVLEELMGVEHVVIVDLGLGREAINVSFRPVGWTVVLLFLSARAGANYRHAERMTAGAASYPDDENARLFSE